MGGDKTKGYTPLLVARVVIRGTRKQWNAAAKIVYQAGMVAKAKRLGSKRGCNLHETAQRIKGLFDLDGKK